MTRSSCMRVHVHECHAHPPLNFRTGILCKFPGIMCKFRTHATASCNSCISCNSKLHATAAAASCNSCNSKVRRWLGRDESAGMSQVLLCCIRVRVLGCYMCPHPAIYFMQDESSSLSYFRYANLSYSNYLHTLHRSGEFPPPKKVTTSSTADQQLLAQRQQRQRHPPQHRLRRYRLRPPMTPAV